MGFQTEFNSVCKFKSGQMELVRRLTEEEARVQTALAHEMFFGIQEDKQQG